MHSHLNVRLYDYYFICFTEQFPELAVVIVHAIKAFGGRGSGS